MPTSDVIVIGLGAMGAATTYQLARRGASVIGIDRYAPPHAYGSSTGSTRITRQAIGEGARYVPLALRSHELWREIEAETGADLLTVTGALIMAAESWTSGLHGTDDFVAGTIAAARQYGIAHEVLDTDAIRSRFPLFRLHEGHRGYYEPGAGFVRPEAAIAAQLELAERHGATISRDERVVAVRPVTGGVEVVTDKRSYRAGQAVLSAGPWITELIGDADLGSLFRRYRQVLYWFDLDAPVARYGPAEFPVFIWEFGANGEQIYGFPAVDGQHGGLKVATEEYGGTTTPETIRREVGDDEVRRMYADMLHGRIAGLSDRLVRAVSCWYTVTPDHGFVIDRVPSNPAVTLVSACSGHGFKHSAAIGEAVATWALDGRPGVDLSPFGLDRFAR